MRLKHLAPVLLLAALAGCGHGGAHPAASPAPTGMTDAQILAIGQQFAQCLRSHGLPDLPDPQVSGGELTWGSDNQAVKDGLSGSQAAQDACRPILDRLPATAHHGASYSAADIQHLIQFAQCLRQHGVPEWPDPKADGTFPLRGTPLEREGKSPRMQAAIQACQQYWDKGIEGS